MDHFNYHYYQLHGLRCKEFASGISGFWGLGENNINFRGNTGEYSNNIFGLQGKVHLIYGNKGKFMRGSREVGTGGPDPPRKSRQRNTMA